MNRGEAGSEGSNRIRPEAGGRDARLAEMERAHRRLGDLYEVSTLLTRFHTVEETVPEVVALLAGVLPLRSAMFILETAEAPHTISWQAPDEDPAQLRAARTHAQAAYRYLVRPDVDLERDQSLVLTLPWLKATGRQAGGFILLPLVVNQGSIFGAFQVGMAGALDEADLVFVNLVVNQLAIAVDRQAVITAEKESAEAREKEQHLLADVSAVVGSSLERRDVLAALTRSVVPAFADLCVLDETGDDGRIQHREAAFGERAKGRARTGLMRRLPPQEVLQAIHTAVLAARTPLLASSVADLPREADALRANGIQSLIAVPLLARGRALGVLTFAMAESGRRYSKHDLTLAEELARRTAIAIDNAQLYEQARRMTQARDNLLAIVSHDLKSPLGVILMNLQMLLRARGSDDWQKSLKQLEFIQRSANWMNRLIQDLLETASIEAGHLSMEKRRLAVGPLVLEAVEALQPLAAARSLHLTSELPAHLPEVLADAARIQQVLANLLGNAIKFTPEGGAIAVRARRTGGVVTVSVADTGRGITKEDLPHVFDRFWQSQRTARQGTGLGLFIVKGIVEAHGGKAWAASRVGRGSTFLFTIPVAPPAGTERAEESQAPAPGAGQAEAELGAATASAALPAVNVLSAVSHGLRGPLTSLELQIERLQRDRETPPTPPQRQIIQRMLATLGRLTAVIESVLQYALIQSGRLSAQIEPFSASTMAAGVVEELRPLAQEKGLELRFTAAEGLPVLLSDPVLVRLILLNLTANAIRFTERGQVVVSVDCPAGAHRLSVKDSGPGILAEDEPRVFEAFFQGEDARQKHPPGVGLGLALVREAVSALGGQVNMESEVGRGSTFTVTLPQPSLEVVTNEPALH